MQLYIWEQHTHPRHRMKHRMLETEDFEKDKCNDGFKSGSDRREACVILGCINREEGEGVKKIFYSSIQRS